MCVGELRRQESRARHQSLTAREERKRERGREEEREKEGREDHMVGWVPPLVVWGYIPGRLFSEI